MSSISFADVVHPADVGVRDLASEAHFVDETLHPPGIDGDVHWKKLQRNALSHLEVVRSIDFTHPTPSEQAGDPVSPSNHRSWLKSCRIGCGERRGRRVGRVVVVCRWRDQTAASFMMEQGFDLVPQGRIAGTGRIQERRPFNLGAFTRGVKELRDQLPTIRAHELGPISPASCREPQGARPFLVSEAILLLITAIGRSVLREPMGFQPGMA